METHHVKHKLLMASLAERGRRRRSTSVTPTTSVSLSGVMSHQIHATLCIRSLVLIGWHTSLRRKPLRWLPLLYTTRSRTLLTFAPTNYCFAENAAVFWWESEQQPEKLCWLISSWFPFLHPAARNHNLTPSTSLNYSSQTSSHCWTIRCGRSVSF